MATNLNITSNYVGEKAGEIIGKAFREADTISRGLINVIPNVNNKVYLRKIDYTNGRQDYACGWSPAGDIDLSEVILEPKVIMNQLDICKEEFRQVFDQANMGFSSWNDDFQALDEATALQTEVLLSTAVATDSDIWVGAISSGRFLGFIPKLQTAGGFISVTATASVTSTNVAGEIAKVVSAIPTSLKRQPDLVFGISTNIADALGNYNALQGYANGLGNRADVLAFGRYTLEVIDALPDDCMIVYQKKNLNFGTGLLSDHNELRIKDMTEVDLTDVVKFKLVYSAGTAIVRPDEVVLYI